MVQWLQLTGEWGIETSEFQSSEALYSTSFSELVLISGIDLNTGVNLGMI